MNVTALILSNVLIYIQIAVLVALRQPPPGRPRTGLAMASGAVLGLLFGITVARIFIARWDALVLLAGLLLAANTAGVSYIFTDPASVGRMRAASARDAGPPPPGELGPLGRLVRGWIRLPARWKLAEVLSLGWLLVSVLITLSTTAQGDRPPASLRAAASFLTLTTLIVITVATVKAWRLGALIPDLDAPDPPGTAR